ncbi:MAG: hypothetical protein U0Q16_35870 [Bryobacteraceae bacterium]
MDREANFVLALLARALAEHGLEAVLIGNMAALIRGAPVTAVAVDFMFRNTPRNLKKLKALSKSLGGTLFKTMYPEADFYQLQRDHDGLRINFSTRVAEVGSFDDLRRRASLLRIGSGSLLVAPLPGFDQPLGAIEAECYRPPAERPLRESAARRQKSEALKKESDLALRDLIRRRLAMTVEQRVAHALRKKIGLRAIAI